MKYNIFIKKK